MPSLSVGLTMPERVAVPGSGEDVEPMGRVARIAGVQDVVRGQEDATGRDAPRRSNDREMELAGIARR